MIKSYLEYVTEAAKYAVQSNTERDKFLVTFKTANNTPAVVAVTLDNKPFTSSREMMVIKIKRGQFWKKYAEAKQDRGEKIKHEDTFDLFRYFQNPWLDEIKWVTRSFKEHVPLWLKFMGNTVEYKKYSNKDQFLKDLLGKWRIHHGYISKLGIYDGINAISTDENHAGFDIIYEVDITQRKKDEIKKLLSEVERYLRRVKLDKKLLYGKIIVSKTIRGTVLGLYYSHDDTIKLKSNVKADKNAIHTIIHELGHRHWFKILNQIQRDNIQAMYRDLKQNKDRKSPVSNIDLIYKDFIKDLSIGDTVTYTGRKKKFKNFSPYTITKIDGDTIKIASVELPQATLEGKLPAFRNWKFNGKELKVDYSSRDDIFLDDYFTSEYSKTNEKEFYAELFAYYVFGNIKNKDVLKFIKTYI